MKNRNHTMKKTTITMPDEMFWDLKQFCLAENINQQALFQQLLSSHLKKYKSKNDLPKFPVKPTK